MQPLDPADKRPTYVRIAGSLRAAIQTGEVPPGQPLPTGQELAAFYGVNRATVAKAIDLLRDEGYLRSAQGAGVYVQERAELPVPGGEAHPMTGAAAFLHEMGQLKNLPRSGWLLLGIPQPESVAEHSFRVGMVAMVLAALAGADVGHTAALATFHDAHETRIGDVPSVGRAYVSTARPEAVTAHQVAGMPDEAAKMLQALTDEYELNVTECARLAHDADKLETLLQAREYAAQGYATGPWSDTSLAALRTETGQELARAITSADPSAWWSTFAASYHELRKSTRGQHD